MKIGRRAAIIGLIAFILVVGSLSIAIQDLVDRNGERLVQEIQKSVGRALGFERLRVEFWRGLALSVKLLRVAEDGRFAATPLIQAKELRLQLRWLPLILGRVEVKRLILVEPEIQIIRNEAGDLNLVALPVPKDSQPEPKEKRSQTASRLRLSSVRVVNGKIFFVDRFLKEPAEVVIRNVDLEIKNPTLTGKVRIKIAANLFESQRQNVSLDGWIGPLQGENSGVEPPWDFQVHADTLLLSQLTRAIPSLREKADFYLGVTGPVTLKARLLGTFQRPRITNVTLAAAVFGSSKDNLTLSGEWDFSHADSWKEGKIKGEMTLDPLRLDQLRKLPAVKRALPSYLVSGGLLGVTAALQGSWDDLNVRARIKASESEIQYGEWFKKPKGIPAEIELQCKREKDRLLFSESTVTVRNTKFLFSGSLEARPERLLRFQLRSGKTDLSGWDRFLPVLSSYSSEGNFRFDVAIKRNFGFRDGNLDIRGSLDLANVKLKDKKDGRIIERITASVLFNGTEARVENGSLRLGLSDVSFKAALRDFSQAIVSYSLQSSKINLADLTALAVNKSDEMRTLIGAGDIDFGTAKTWVRGHITSAEGVVQELPYRNLQGDVSWSAGNLSLRNVSLQVLSGTLQGGGDWETGAGNSRRLVLEPHVENVDLKPLLTQKLPEFKNHIDGKLSLSAQLRGASYNGANLRDSIQGAVETRLFNGSINDFNLVELVLTKITALPGMSNLISPRMSERYGPLLNRKDTPFSSLTATFTVEQGRILSKDLRMVSPDYAVYGEGWIGFDKSMRLNATLVMPVQMTRELMQEQKNIRYLLDRQGRLTIPFRLDGTLPRIQAKPDLQRLADTIQRGFRGKDRPAEIGGLPTDGTKRKPTPDASKKEGPYKR